MHVTKKALTSEWIIIYEFEGVMIGFGRTLHHKEPERIKGLVRAVDARIRGAGLCADSYLVGMAKEMENYTYAIVEEGGEIPEGGIEFDIPPEYHGKIPKSLLSSVRRLHFNSGHPPNVELERIVRLSGGSELARIAVEGIQCSVCRKSQRPKSAKPGRSKVNIGQFNDTVLIDLGYCEDADGDTHGWAVMVD